MLFLASLAPTTRARPSRLALGNHQSKPLADDPDINHERLAISLREKPLLTTTPFIDTQPDQGKETLHLLSLLH
jgi:hypothetical protein